ncbi:hypothetical protein LBMAG56_34650 [Verrucomicrobiota bacterium]|nr:hypothetical protein LBMAG56_34650 [Verrucomicrobiota bacterium]
MKTAAAITPSPATANAPAPAPALPLRHLLVPFDFSESARQTVTAAVALARPAGARITLLYVLPVTLPADIAHVSVVLDNRKLLAHAREQLAAFARSAIPAEIPVDIQVAEGGPYHEINAIARALGTDLIVIGTRGLSGVKHLVLGSTAERVVRHAPCPVLTWHISAAATTPTTPEPPATAPAGAFQHLLVPVDFSPANDEALRHAVRIATIFGSHITLLHVIEPPPYPEWGYAHLTRRDEGLKQAARLKLATLSADLQRRGCTVNPVRVTTGDADSQICRMAGELHASLVVIATHGHSALAQMFLGGTAERVLRHAPCPVLVVRAKTA